MTQAGEHFLDAFQCLDNRTSLHLNYAYDKEVLRVYESQDSAAMCEHFCIPKDSVLLNLIDAHGWDAFPMIMDVLERETKTILDEEELIVDTVSDIASLAIGGFIDFDACESILPKVRGISRIAESAFEPLRVLSKGSEQIYLDWFLSDLENLFTTWLRGMGCTPKKDGRFFSQYTHTPDAGYHGPFLEAARYCLLQFAPNIFNATHKEAKEAQINQLGIRMQKKNQNRKIVK